MSIPTPGLLHVITITKSIHNLNVQCREVLDSFRLRMTLSRTSVRQKRTTIVGGGAGIVD